MTGDQIAQFVYLSLIATAIGGWLFAQNRRNLGQLAQYAVIWGLIFVGVLGAAGLWSEIRRDVAPSQALTESGAIEVPQGRDGHFYLTALVQGRPVLFIVDTGATDIVLSRRDAEAVGIDVASLIFSGTAMTANGPVRTAPVTLRDVSVEGITDTAVRAVVNEGEIDASLLGMAFLSRFDRIEIADGRMLLYR